MLSVEPPGPSEDLTKKRAGSKAPVGSGPRTRLDATSPRLYRRYEPAPPTKSQIARAILVALLILAIFFILAFMILIENRLAG